MNAGTTPGIDRKVLLSTLWIVVMMNMLLADILSLNVPGAAEVLAKTAGATPIPMLMLVGAIGVEVSIVMIILSRVLRYGVNRWVNIVAGVFTILFIWGAGSPHPHYTFLAAAETICLLVIIWTAWKWQVSEQ